jgi:DNA-binding LytR/AlgR family response regulator
MLNVAFCDDDYTFLVKIIAEAKKIFMTLNVPAHFYALTNGNKLVDNFKEYNPYYDIIFLDIDMPLINGKDVAKKLRLLDKKFKLIFITSYEQEAINTFEYQVIGFLSKLKIHEKLPEIVKRVVDAICFDNQHMQIFKVNTNNGIINVKLPLNDIMYFECVNKKIFLHSVREVFSLYGYKFSDILHKYANCNFVDIHRTCFVNIKFVYSIDEIEIVLDNGIHLPLSRRKKNHVLDKFVQIVSEEISK